jgi:hypothetical protein
MKNMLGTEESKKKKKVAKAKKPAVGKTKNPFAAGKKKKKEPTVADYIKGEK